MPSNQVPRLGAPPRRLILGIVLVTVTAWALMILVLARGGRPDPPQLRAEATLLDGAWRFHVGDDPGWADPATDDGGWETIDLTAPPGSHDGDVGLPDYVGGWMARGHPEYTGYAWYRRRLAVPAGEASWEILGPTLVEEGYELYWNGQLLGGSGRLGAEPRVVGTRPLKFAVPAGAAGRSGVVAVRVYMRPGAGTSADGGGMHTPPILAPLPVGDALHRVEWERTIAGYILDAVEPLAMFGIIALILWGVAERSRRGFLVFAGIALALTGLRRLNNAITAWTDLQDLDSYAFLARVMWIPTVGAWIMAWNRWGRRPARIIDALAVVAVLGALAGAFGPGAVVTTWSRFGFLALLVVSGAGIARRGPERVLALVSVAMVIAAFFGSEVLDPLGVPGIWFPFGIGVSRTQYIYGVLVPLLAVLVVSTDGAEDGAVGNRPADVSLGATS